MPLVPLKCCTPTTARLLEIFITHNQPCITSHLATEWHPGKCINSQLHRCMGISRACLPTLRQPRHQHETICFALGILEEAFGRSLLLPFTLLFLPALLQTN